MKIYESKRALRKQRDYYQERSARHAVTIAALKKELGASRQQATRLRRRVANLETARLGG